jgi:GNAT superfamily N-acetyltransferase
MIFKDCYDIRLLQFNDGDKSLQKVVDLQNLVYEGKHNFKIDGFKQWYLSNPMGKVVSFNAFYDDELVAHYACIPYKMEIEGRIVTGLFDMATVTHPDHRGKGLFKKLAQTTYDYAKEQGFEFVLGVANANSYPGYMKYFPFTFVGQLEVKMGLGIKIECDGEKTYKVYWDKDAFNWRLDTCRANYSRNKNSILGQYNSFVQTYMGSYPDDFLNGTNAQDKHWGFRPKLYVGMGAKFKSIYLKVPKFIKRSPFNLIFLDLTDGNLPPVNKDNIFFQLFDFDVA